MAYPSDGGAPMCTCFICNLIHPHIPHIPRISQTPHMGCHGSKPWYPDGTLSHSWYSWMGAPCCSSMRMSVMFGPIPSYPQLSPAILALCMAISAVSSNSAHFEVAAAVVRRAYLREVRWWLMWPWTCSKRNAVRKLGI